MRQWLQTYFGWIPPFLDWIDDQLKRARIIGTIGTIALIVVHHGTCNERDLYKNKSEKLVKKTDSLQHKADSCNYELINHKY